MALNALIAGLIMRPLGRVAAATTALFLALWPLSVTVERTVELEPFLVFFCLLGTYLIFGSNDLASWRRVFVGALAFGFAVEVKVWAVLPIVALGVVCLPRWRSRGMPLASGIAIGAAVPGLPFFIAAPRAFVHEVIVDQISRNANPLPSTPLSARLLALSGIARLPDIGPRTGLAVALCSVFALVCVWVYVIGFRRRVMLEWFALVVTVVVFVGMFEDPVLDEFYSYFPAAFTALLAGVCARVLWVSLMADRPMRAQQSHGGIRRTARVLVAALGLAVALFLVQQEVAYAQGDLLLYSDPSAQIQATIPSGACVISDIPTILLAANRFTPARPGCPADVDPFGAFIAEDGGRLPTVTQPPYPVAFEEQWFSSVETADYVVVSVPYSDYFPWGDSTIRWFSQNYPLVAHYTDQYPVPPAMIQAAMPDYTFYRAAANIYIYENLSNLRN